MPKHESLDQSASTRWKGGHLADYKPAFPLGNERDAEIIARSSGHRVEEFLNLQPVDELTLQRFTLEDKKES